jgi:hypothetical protein
MDRAGVERAVLLGWYWRRAENCARQNRFFADLVRRHPERLSAFATVQPAAGADQAVAELQRARAEGLCGIGELSPQAQGYAMEGAEFSAVLAWAAEFNWPVNLHVTDARGPIYPGRIETAREEFVHLARAWPNVTLVLAHWGGGEPVGDATAARARAAGFGDVTSAGRNAEALAALVGARCRADGGTLLLPTAEGEGLVLARTLRAAGFAVARRTVYAAVPQNTLPA